MNESIILFTKGCWSLWSMSTFMLMGWNSSLLLKKIYADGWFRRAEKTEDRSLIHGTAAETSAPVIAEQNKWMILQMSAVHRQVTGTTSQHYWQGREEEVLSTLHVGAGDAARLITIWKWEQIKESSDTRKYKTCAHTGHMTFVPGTFASGNNEPACLFPASLVLIFFFFFPAKQRLLWS